MTQATTVKKQILASKIAYKRSLNNEQQLERELSHFFNTLKKEVLDGLNEYWKDYQMLQGHIDLITAPVHEAHKEYYELLTLYIKREYRLGSAEAKRLVKLANSKQRVASKSMRMPVRAIIKNDNDLFGTLPSAEERLLNRTFTASERTLSRVDSQINQIITDGYRSGKGINDVANSLTQRFDQLTSWESKRIARTEIHNSHNIAVMDTYKELDVEYTMWITAHDERVRGLKKGDRANHVKLDGEIIPMGETYSNGLKYPGDTDGPLVEWINCRCSNAPFVVPYGFMAPPDMQQFRESDLIKIETKDPKQLLEELNAPKEEESWLNGNYEVSREGNDTIYTHNNGLKIVINDNSKYTYEEIKQHISTLPKALRDIPTEALNEINIKGVSHRQYSGLYTSLSGRVDLYLGGDLNTLTHELSHAFDYSKGAKTVLASDKYGLSHLDVYGKIVQADNELYAYVRPNGKTRIPNKFPTDYAGRSWIKSNKLYKQKLKTWKGGSQDPSLKPNNNGQYVEDFAESTQLYLNPTTHAKFIEEFPNRAKYLEKLYGKPKFK